MSKSALLHLRPVCQLLPFIESAGLAMLIHAFVTLQLDYCKYLCWAALEDILKTIVGSECGSLIIVRSNLAGTYLAYLKIPISTASLFVIQFQGACYSL